MQYCDYFLFLKDLFINNLNKAKITLGRTEIVTFPDLGIENITAKIDTGAYSTAIHAHKFWTETKEDVEELYFQLLDPSKEEFVNRIYKTANFYKKKVRSSNGRMEERFILKTTIRLGGKLTTTHLSLTNRERMRYPVLVGRKVLAKGYLVDVSKKNTTK
mgnify:CR=1 FL=1